jgi:hypothetical protein
MNRTLILLICTFIIFNGQGYSQQKSKSSENYFMFYNVENLFDCENDSSTNDDEFTAQGDRNWTSKRLLEKTNRIAKVILASGKWNPPVFVGLCEIENQKVLDLLTKRTALASFNYKTIHKESPDERGIDCAFIYRPDLFRPIDYQTFALIDSSDTSFRTREILLVNGVLFNCDTIHVFINHWPSRYGGAIETQRYRKLAATLLKNAIRNVGSGKAKAKIICAGDFNDSPHDESIKLLLGTSPNQHVKPVKLINLSESWLSEPVKTIKSQYSWEVFDQWIVSEDFLNSGKCFQFTEAEIQKIPFLLEPDEKFGGLKPKRSYIGYKYQDGFSDHLPITLKISLTDH